MVSTIHKELQVKVPLAQIFKTPHIRGLAEYINGQEQDKYASIEPVEQKEYYGLSSAQKRLYLLQQMNPATTAYNMPETIPIQLTGETDRENLENRDHRLGSDWC